MKLAAAAALTVAIAPLSHVGASTGCAADAMLVFDGSASMAELGFDQTAPTRIDDARQALRQAMPEIAPIRRVGLLVYGPGPEGSCDGITLHFPPRRNAAEAVIEAVERFDPVGLTPLTASVEAAADVLDYREKPAIIVLVTDGNETCGGRPCSTGKELAISARDLTIHVIGFRVVADPFAWDSPEAGVYSDGASVAKCLSDGTGGKYVSTETVDELSEALRETLGCALIG